MQKRLLPALVGVALLMTLCMNVLAAFTDFPIAGPGEGQYSNPRLASILLDAALYAESPAAPTVATGSNEPELIVNGVPLHDKTTVIMMGDTTYVPMRSMIQALYPDAQVTWEVDQLVATGPGFYLTARPGENYLTVNDRCLYAPAGIVLKDGITMAPIRAICVALGATTKWDMLTHDISVSVTGTPLLNGASYYNSDDLYWLSRIITAESRNQPLSGKIAVGTVILNRVASAQFPNSVYDVIFQENQFTPVENGMIYDEPTEEGVVAAKLVLEGAREAGASLFFNRSDIDCWASRNRTLITTIADHSFYS